MKYKFDENINLIYEEQGGVIYNNKTEEFFGLDYVGCIICKKIQKGNAIEDIIKCIEKQYSINYDVAQKDTIDFINMLFEHYIIIEDQS